MKERTINQLNQRIVTRKRAWCETMLYAANYINEWNSSVNHAWMLGDVMLFKHNLITKRQLRRNPVRKP